MPWIIDYPTVVETLRSSGMRCNYHNSGAFGFEDAAATKTIGFIGPDDPTIRPAAAPFVRRVEEPYEINLVALLSRVWHDVLPGRVWVMPASHWAYELEFGSSDWLPTALENAGVDPGQLVGRNNASAIEFSPAEAAEFEAFVTRLLEMLTGSDFTVAFPGRPALCMVHHHKQLWWTTNDDATHRAIDTVVTA